MSWRLKFFQLGENCDFFRGLKKHFRKIDDFFREDVVTSGGGLCFFLEEVKVFSKG